jgi:hypothetical protein
VSVEFEPVRLGSRRRRLDPVALGAVLVALALVVSIVKPWDRPASGTPEASEAPAASLGETGPSDAVASTTPAASPVLPRVLSTRPGTSPSWTEIEPIVRRHESWGIRAIVRNPYGATGSATPRYAERWFRFPAGGTQMSTAFIDGDHSIVALGVTFPPSHAPLDVRIWRLGRGDPEWIDTEALDPTPSGGAFVYVRPGDAGGPAKPWGSGRYRIDVLVDGSIRRLGVDIPDRFSNLPAGVERPSLRDIGRLAEPAEAVLPDLTMGLFATVDRIGVPLPSVEGPSLDEVGAWLNLDPGTGRTPRSFVAAAYIPRATGLGVMLPPGSVVQSARLERLPPAPLPGEPPRVEGLLDDAGRPAPPEYVLFAAPDGGPWAPGTYRLSVVWADADGLHDRSWHAELRPGPVRALPRLLAAARSWARYAGVTGVILGTTEPLIGGPRSAVIRLVRLRPDDAAYPVVSGIGCGGTVIDGNPGIIGFAYPDEQYASTVRARILRPFLRRGDQVVMTAAFGLRGLILVAPARRPILTEGTYRFTVGDDEDARDFALCLGMQTFDD